MHHERIAVSPVSLTSWMAWLFEDKLAQQKEALSDVKQLADVIAAQQGPTFDGTFTGTGAAASSIPSLVPARRSPAPFIAVGVAIALGGAGLFYMQTERAAKKAEADAAARAPPRRRPSMSLIQELGRLIFEPSRLRG